MSGLYCLLEHLGRLCREILLYKLMISEARKGSVRTYPLIRSSRNKRAANVMKLSAREHSSESE
jgi:hypothetical protein